MMHDICVTQQGLILKRDQGAKKVAARAINLMTGKTSRTAPRQATGLTWHKCI